MFSLLQVQSFKKYKWIVVLAILYHKRGTAIGRLHFVPPTAGEHFYLHMLLMVVKGSKLFMEIKSYQGIEHQTFKAACLAWGLLEDGSEWMQCLQEVAGATGGGRVGGGATTTCSTIPPEATHARISRRA